MQGVRHHVDPEESPFGPKDVVPPGGGTRLCGGVRHHVRVAGGSDRPIGVVLPDEELRLCGGRSTTSGSPEARTGR